MPLVKLPIHGCIDKFALVDPEDVSCIVDGGLDNKYCWISVKGAYGAGEDNGSIGIELSAIDTATRLGKLVVEAINK